MELKSLLREDIKREHEYLRELEVGSEEYNESLKRLSNLEDKLFELEKFEFESANKSEQIKDEKKDKTTKNALEITKIVVSIVVPIVGLIGITAQEKEITFCGALKDYAKLFIPKKPI